MTRLTLRQDGADFWSEDGGRTTAPDRVWRGSTGDESIQACQQWAREFYGGLGIEIEIIDQWPAPPPEVGDRIYVNCGTYAGQSGRVIKVRADGHEIAFRPDGSPHATLCCHLSDVRKYGEDS